MHRQCLILIVLCLTVSIGSASNAWSSEATFHPIPDDESLRFQATYPCGDARRCRVSRVTVQEPNYDGPPGYTALLATSQPIVGPGIWQEELVAFVRGQVRLLGVEPETHRVLTFRTAQRGAARLIAQLVQFDAKHPQGTPLGPEGAFQYVSCQTSGRHCVLVDDGVTWIHLSSGDTRRLQIAAPIPHEAADPPQQTERGFEIGGGHRLDGEFMEMIWLAESGTLRLRDAEGWREIEIDLTSDVPK